MFEVDPAVGDLLPIEHHCCFAHTIQLVIKDGFKKSGHIGSTIGKCSKLVSFVRKSTIASEALEGEKVLQAANATRWNSQLKMIRSILSISPEKLDSLDCSIVLSAHERNILKDVMEILSPFEEATDAVQVDLHPSAGYVLPCTRGLKYQLDNMSSKYHSAFVQELKSSLSTRMAAYEINETYTLAATLDSLFKLYWCHNEQEKEEVKSLLCKEKALLTSIMSPSENTTSVQSDEDNDEPQQKRRKIFTFIDEKQKSFASELQQNNEIEDYLREPCIQQSDDPLEYWRSREHSYPALAIIARHVLIVPASSAPVERLFSIAGKIFKPDRCRLKDSTFEQLMFIKCNKK
jgi:hypothetical protein